MKVRWATLTTVTSRIAITVAKMHTPEIRSSAASSLSGYSRSVAPGCPVGACGGVLAAAYGASSMALLSISNRPDSPAPAAPIRLSRWVSAYTPAVCVSFTIPTPEIVKLLVCLEN